jgi:hypothetical protein
MMDAWWAGKCERYGKEREKKKKKFRKNEIELAFPEKMQYYIYWNILGKLFVFTGAAAFGREGAV